MSTNEASSINKKAWEYRAYEFWNIQHSPRELGEIIKTAPYERLKEHSRYFQNVKGLKIANPCGSNGRKAVPLAVLGADVTVFDISEENKRYAMELAKCAGADIKYIVGDFYDAPTSENKGEFDLAYLEGGILHYFHDLDRFISVLHHLIRPGGTLLLSDFHPLRKVLMERGEKTDGDYFDSNIHEGDIAYLGFFSEEEKSMFPKCSLRFYTVSEIINTVIKGGFTLKEYNEHPNWQNEKLPGDFTVVATRN